MFSLLPWQLPHASAIERSLRENRVALDTSLTGRGKSYVAAEMARRLGLCPVVFTRKSVVPAWREVLSSAGLPTNVINYEKAIRGENFPGYLSIERTVKPATRPGRKPAVQLTLSIPPAAAGRLLLVFDEAQACKGENTQATALLLAAANTREHILLASATAIESPEDMRGLGVTLGLFRDRDFFHWKMAHGVRKLWHGHFGMDPKAKEWALPKIRAAIGDKMHGINDAPGFPDNYVHTSLAPLPERISADLSLRIGELLAQGRDAQDALVELLRQRQAVELCKAEWMADRAASAWEEGQAVVAFLCFRESIAHFANTFTELTRERVPTLHGGTALFAREKMLEDFQADRTRILAAQISAGGVGVSLHDLHGNHPRLSLISPSQSARDLIQALGRIHRAGARTPCVQEIVLADHPLEHALKRLLDGKIGAMETLTDMDLLSSSPFPVACSPVPDTADPTCRLCNQTTDRPCKDSDEAAGCRRYQ